MLRSGGSPKRRRAEPIAVFVALFLAAELRKDVIAPAPDDPNSLAAEFDATCDHTGPMVKHPQ